MSPLLPSRRYPIRPQQLRITHVSVDWTAVADRGQVTPSPWPGTQRPWCRWRPWRVAGAPASRAPRPPFALLQLRHCSSWPGMQRPWCRWWPWRVAGAPASRAPRPCTRRLSHGGNNGGSRRPASTSPCRGAGSRRRMSRDAVAMVSENGAVSGWRVVACRCRRRLRQR